MSKRIDISQTRFQLGDDIVRGVAIRPGLRIEYHPEDDADFLTPGEAGELRDWLNKHYPAELGEPK